MAELPHSFWVRVRKTDTCWVWTGSVCGRYGRYRVGGVDLSAHRFAYEYLVGPIPDGLQIDHLCRNTCCVNPDHLEPVTPRENSQRGNGGRNHSSKTHCAQGHEYSLENTGWRVYPNGVRTRYCRACNRKNANRWYAAKKMAA